MDTINITTHKHSEMINFTQEVNGLIPKGFKSGICHIFCQHTTAGLTINENADPDVQRDLLAATEELVPWNNPLFRHYEGNSAAHLKASFMGFSQTVPIDNGKLCLGVWQGIYFCEFDGPRSRKVLIQFIEDHNG